MFGYRPEDWHKKILTALDGLAEQTKTVEAWEDLEGSYNKLDNL